MQYLEKRVEGFLSNFIKCFWQYENALDDAEYSILPDGYFDLIFEFENNIQKKSYLTGIWTESVTVNIKKNTKLIGIRFKLPAAEFIFDMSIKNILNTSSEIFENRIDFKNVIFYDFESATNLLINKFADILQFSVRIDNRKLRLFELLYQSNEELKISEIADIIGWSSRQINRYFNKQFGFSLKTFLNILNCRSSYSEIANGQLSPTNYYFDQSHFIKNVKRYTGATPKELYKNKNDRFLQLSTLKTP